MDRDYLYLCDEVALKFESDARFSIMNNIRYSTLVLDVNTIQSLVYEFELFLLRYIGENHRETKYVISHFFVNK